MLASAKLLQLCRCSRKGHQTSDCQSCRAGESVICACAQVFERVPVQPRDAREASDVFYKQGLGDVLLNYENEVVLTNDMFGDKALPYIVPDNNVNVRPLLHAVILILRQQGLIRTSSSSITCQAVSPPVLDFACFSMRGTKRQFKGARSLCCSAGLITLTAATGVVVCSQLPLSSRSAQPQPTWRRRLWQW